MAGCCFLTAWRSAPASSNRRTSSDLPDWIAEQSGLQLCLGATAFTEAPWESKSCTMSTFPAPAAYIKGVQPLADSRSSASAPKSSSAFTAASCLRCTATSIGVQPQAPVRFSTTAPSKPPPGKVASWKATSRTSSWVGQLRDFSSSTIAERVSDTGGCSPDSWLFFFCSCCCCLPCASSSSSKSVQAVLRRLWYTLLVRFTEADVGTMHCWWYHEKKGVPPTSLGSSIKSSEDSCRETSALVSARSTESSREEYSVSSLHKAMHNGAEASPCTALATSDTSCHGNAAGSLHGQPGARPASPSHLAAARKSSEEAVGGPASSCSPPPAMSCASSSAEYSVYSLAMRSFTKERSQGVPNKAPRQNG
mmetsp:Transcript_143894/g.460616  ORF Transcript_143894/g.460616 Transcript_143894/m.460616 type:complete len:365 (-) Transcript_143894:90-1184(-)